MRFEEVKNPVHNRTTVLPTRATTGSAGYDFRIKEDLTIPSGETVLTWTDVKARINSDTVLLIIPRSSLGIKHGIALQNTVGVIDSDYYGNEDNDGNIAIALLNTGKDTVYLYEGERVAQGIIVPYRTTDSDETEGKRSGGIGSSGQ